MNLDRTRSAPGTESDWPWYIYASRHPSRCWCIRSRHACNTNLPAAQRTWDGVSDRIVVVDDDLGKSGASAAGRAGFQRVVTEVSLDHVGIILDVEMSRL